MPLFTSAREKRLWVGALMVVVIIFITLFVGRPLANLFTDGDVRAAIFLLVMLLVGATIIAHGLNAKPSQLEISILLGIIAVYIMFFLRLGLPERTHLIEYSVLAIFIHKAIVERMRNGKNIRVPALWAMVGAFLIGVLDECIQIFLPNRVFDLEDILFNGMAVTTAIGSSLILKWARKKMGKT